MSSKTIDFKKAITNKIIELLEGPELDPLGKLWVNMRKFDSNTPYNLLSKKNYRGCNILIIALATINKNYKSNAYLTFKQAKELGGNVKKGEKGITVFYNAITKNSKQLSIDQRDESDKVSNYFFMKTYTLFNIEQCEKIPPEKIELKIKAVTNKDNFNNNYFNQIHNKFKIYLKNVNIKYEIDGNMPCYIENKINPKIATVKMPALIQFKNESDFLAVLAHECIHSSGNPLLLNRDAQSYALEELVAELGSAFLCHELGINGKYENHAAYIKSWLVALKNDYNAIFKAAAMASKAYDFIIDNSMVKIEAKAA